MSKTKIERVLEAWWNGEYKEYASSPFWSTGDGTLKSYRTAIAYRDPDDSTVVYVNSTSYSPQTARHQHELAVFLKDKVAPNDIRRVANQQRGVTGRDLRAEYLEVNPKREADLRQLISECSRTASELGHTLDWGTEPSIIYGAYAVCTTCREQVTIRPQTVTKWSGPDARYNEAHGNVLRRKCDPNRRPSITPAWESWTATTPA